eukprot:1160962-Pelagomonas_calceolata.AAC.14
MQLTLISVQRTLMRTMLLRSSVRHSSIRCSSTARQDSSSGDTLGIPLAVLRAVARSSGKLTLAQVCKLH